MYGSCRAGLRLGGLVAVVMAAQTPALAVNFEYGGAEFSWTNRLVLGGGVRLEDREEDLIGKLNLNPDLCPDDCISFTGDPEPNQRLVDAPGAFIGSNSDNGNLNYDKWDLISGQLRLETELTGFYGDLAFKISGVGLYDAVNNNFDASHPDTAFQPASDRRHHDIDEQIGATFDVLDAFVSYPFQIGDRDFNISVGEQRVRWGESTFAALGSLDQINPPDQNRLNFPGSQIASVFEPVGLAVLTTNITPNVSAELVYQYDWEGVIPAASGSFFSTSIGDIAGDGEYAVVGLGQFSEDPMQIGSFKGDTPQLISSSSTSVRVPPAFENAPDPGTQGGIRINWFAEDLNDGTDLGFYALNYHSRLPYSQITATDRSCIRDRIDLPDGQDLPGPFQDIVNTVFDLTGATLTADGATAFAACGGFNGSLNPTGTGQEPIPIETLGVELAYPEDIHMFGMSFNTQVGKWSLAGEYAFRPNMPLQVSIADVIFAGLQPALPDEDIFLVAGTVPSARNAIPDYLETRYRGNTVTAGQEIDGWERFKVHQIDFTGIRVFSSSNPVGADQIILLTELAVTHIQDFPDRDELQLEGGGPNCTHYSPGADGTGSGGVADTRRLNPTQARGCFADETSAGYRILARFQYNNALFGWTVNPVFALFHDFYNTAPFPAQNFVEDRIETIIGAEIEFDQSWRAAFQYQGFFGNGDRRNHLVDRDNLQMSVEYNF